MTGLRFGWIGEARRAALRALLAAEVGDWSRDWWLRHSPGEVDVSAIELELVRGKAEAVWVSNNAMGGLLLYLDGKGADAVGRQLAGATGDRDEGLGQHIGEDALADLVLRIRRRAGDTQVAAFTRGNVPDGFDDPRWGAYAVALTMGRLQLDLVVDRRLIDRLVPPPAVSELPLLSREIALGNAAVPITASMDFGSISLTQLADLRVGEVLVGDRKLDEVLSLQVDGQGAMATGHLRRRGNQRAVVLDGTKPQQRQ
jgi:hypothetical protein